MERMTMMLPVKLTESEVQQLGREAGELYARIDAERELGKEEARLRKEAIKELTTRLEGKMLTMRFGVMDKPVEVVEERDFVKGLVNTYRVDRDPRELVNSRTMTDAERQRDLPMDEPEPEP